MASVVNRKNGRREVQFTDADGKRQTVRLGKMPKRDAESVKTRIEHLLTAKITKRPLEGDTARWVASLDDVLAGRLAKVGLIRQRESATLAAFVDGYIQNRSDLKPSTVEHLQRVRHDLVDYFGENRPLREITAADADDFRLALLKRGLGDNTIRRRCGRAKQFFNAATRRKLIDSNPFADLKSGVQANPERFHFVTRDDADKVLAACPDAEWRLIFALSRFGGLRCPSEHLALTWDCIDWENERFRINSPKTEHHAGKVSRTIPIFPELRPHLETAFDQAAESSTHVIARYRGANTNLRTQLMRIIERAGLEPWPKLFQNLRSTRETELAEQFPIHVACSWIGNSKAVAAKHYLQTTDEHFKKATQKATQIPTQTVHDNGDWDGPAHQKTPQMSVSDNAGHTQTKIKAPPVGLEPTTRRLTAACSTN